MFPESVSLREENRAWRKNVSPRDIAISSAFRDNFVKGGSDARHVRERNEENRAVGQREATIKSAKREFQFSPGRGEGRGVRGLCGRPIVVAAGFQLKAIVTQPEEQRRSHVSPTIAEFFI